MLVADIGVSLNINLEVWCLSNLKLERNFCLWGITLLVSSYSKIIPLRYNPISLVCQKCNSRNDVGSPPIFTKKFLNRAFSQLKFCHRVKFMTVTIFFVFLKEMLLKSVIYIKTSISLLDYQPNWRHTTKFNDSVWKWN